MTAVARLARSEPQAEPSASGTATMRLLTWSSVADRARPMARACRVPNHHSPYPPYTQTHKMSFFEAMDKKSDESLLKTLPSRIITKKGVVTNSINGLSENNLICGELCGFWNKLILS